MNRISGSMIYFIVRCVTIASIVAVAGLAAWGQEPATVSPPSAQVASEPANRYRVGPGDVLDIRMFKHPELSRDGVRVDGGGMIRMPLIEGEIANAFLTQFQFGYGAD